MKNSMVSDIMRRVEDNLPTILTAAGILAGITTVGYSIFAGWKIKEVADDKSLDKKEKIKKTAKLAAPVILGVVVTGACHIVAHKKSASKLAGALALCGATKLDSEKLKDKAKQLIGDDQKDTGNGIHNKKVTEPLVPNNCKVRIRDDVTGYSFDTTMSDFWEAVNKVNEEAQSDEVSISRFYEELLGKGYTFADIHDHITFGYDSGVSSFRPEFSAAMQGDMSLSYAISYPYNEA